jgi:hypothetical protein
MEPKDTQSRQLLSEPREDKEQLEEEFNPVDKVNRKWNKFLQKQEAKLRARAAQREEGSREVRGGSLAQ